MCRSVPQMDAARTRTRTSPGRAAGTSTLSICAPGSGRGFRRACILAMGISLLSSCPRGMLAQTQGASQTALLRVKGAHGFPGARPVLFRYNPAASTPLDVLVPVDVLVRGGGAPERGSTWDCRNALGKFVRDSILLSGW